MGLLDDIWTKIVGDSAAQQSAPTPQPQPGYGLLSPQMMTPDQFAKNQNSLGGILGAFSGGVLPGLAQLAGGDPNTTAARYNAMLQQAQGVETGRLNLRPFENAGTAGTPSPNQMRSPATATGLPSNVFGPPDPNAAATGLNWGPGGITSAQPTQVAQAGGAPVSDASYGGATPNPGSFAYDPRSLSSLIDFSRQSPAGMANVPKYVDAMKAMLDSGNALDPGGNRYRLGGANSTDYQEAQSKALGTGLLQRSPDGTVSSLPGVIQDAGNKAQATAYGTASGTGAGQLPTAFQLAAQKAAGEGQGQLPTSAQLAYNKALGEGQGQLSTAQQRAYAMGAGTGQADLQYKPQIAGATAWATLDPEAQKARDAAAAKWLSPLEQRPGSQTLFPGGLSGAPQQRPLGYLPTNQRSFTPNAPASQPGPVGNGVLSQNSPEANKDQTNLAEETQHSREAASGAIQQKAIFGQMLSAIPGANLGYGADKTTSWKNFAGTWLGMDTSKSVTQDQVFDKMSTQLAGQATAQLDQTANAALETMRKAYPNREMTEPALREMIGQLTGLQDYVVAKDKARYDFILEHGTASGFQQGEWVKNNPVTKFIEDGKKTAMVKPVTRVIGGKTYIGRPE